MNLFDILWISKETPYTVYIGMGIGCLLLCLGAISIGKNVIDNKKENKKN